jgi:hypothetical protein
MLSEPQSSAVGQRRVPGTDHYIPEIVESAEEANRIYQRFSDIVFRQTQEQLGSAAEQRKKLVLVYQMGKVGSTSYDAALGKLSNLLVFHAHRLNPRDTGKMTANKLSKGRIHMALVERAWEALADFLSRDSGQVHIVSAMRCPIDRNMSAFFQHLRLDGRPDIDELIETFLATYHHAGPARWFQEQFHETLGIDIFRHPFNRERGWDSFADGKYRCLLMTAEINDARKMEALNSFLGTGLRVIQRKNIGSAKDYSDLYRVFKEKISLPRSYVDAQLGSRVVAHFYTPAKIEEFRSRWS